MQTFYHISRRYGGDYPRKRQQFQVDDYFALAISCAARRVAAREAVRREGIVSKITRHCRQPCEIVAKREATEHFRFSARLSPSRADGRG